jgi:hypothetical protein
MEGGHGFRAEGRRRDPSLGPGDRGADPHFWWRRRDRGTQEACGSDHTDSGAFDPRTASFLVAGCESPRMRDHRRLAEGRGGGVWGGERGGAREPRRFGACHAGEAAARAGLCGRRQVQGPPRIGRCWLRRVPHARDRGCVAARPALGARRHVHRAGRGGVATGGHRGDARAVSDRCRGRVLGVAQLRRHRRTHSSRIRCGVAAQGIPGGGGRCARSEGRLGEVLDGRATASLAPSSSDDRGWHAGGGHRSEVALAGVERPSWSAS